MNKNKAITILQTVKTNLTGKHKEAIEKIIDFVNHRVHDIPESYEERQARIKELQDEEFELHGKELFQEYKERLRSGMTKTERQETASFFLQSL